MDHLYCMIPDVDVVGKIYCVAHWMQNCVIQDEGIASQDIILCRMIQIGGKNVYFFVGKVGSLT